MDNIFGFSESPLSAGEAGGRMGLLDPINFLLLMQSANAIVYAIRDQFTTALAAGAVNGTLSEPGPGTRNVIDVSGVGVTIQSTGKLRIVGDGTWNHEGIYLTPAITRAAGLVVWQDVTYVSGAGNGMCGLTTAQDANFSGYNNVGIFLASNGIHQARRSSAGTSANINITAILTGSLVQVLRNSGTYFLYAPADGSDVQLLFWNDWDNTATLYVGASMLNAALTFDFDNFSVPQSQFFNIGVLALASDSFNRADGALGSTDGAGHAEANGGSGKAWTSRLGTWGIASNKAQATALSGGVAFATVDAGTKDIIIECDLTRAGGNAGIVSWTDANNYMLVYHDGTNAIMSETVAGVTNTRISAAATYAANASIRVRRNGAQTIVWYNDLYIGNYGTTNAALTGTHHGLYTTDITNTQNDFICFGVTGYNAIRQAA